MPEAGRNGRHDMDDATRYSYAVKILREDDEPVRQLPVEVDWEPAREALRLQALKAGLAAEQAFTLECAVEPVWHAVRGRPFLGGFRVQAAQEFEAEFPLGYFRELGAKLTSRLVTEGALQKGDRVRCLPVAYPQAPGEAPAALPRIGRPAPPRIPVAQASLNDFPAGANDAGFPVFVPERVLREVGTLTLGAEGRETGGILIGLLLRDASRVMLFAEVTAQIPARHTEACATKLTFTAATWTEVQAALELRGRGELMLGWWHSHPVREWCKDCSEESRKKCSLAQGFLSEDDRLLHRTVFPRAYSLALLANDVSPDGPSFTLFGWQQGQLAQREFHRLGEERHAAA